MSQQTELALVHRLMRDLDSLVLPGQHDLQQAAMLALSALAQTIKLRYTIDELHAELGKTTPRLSVVKTNNELTN
jgi:hypothetical protein